MTSRRVVQLWGEMGVIGRSTAVLVLVGLLWAGVTAAYGIAGSLFVTRPAFQEYIHTRDSVQARLWFRRDSAAGVDYIRDSVFRADFRAYKYRECVRHHGVTACLPEKP